MKNNNKLARNAIRARKAQKKRANEQDKPKQGKRWLSRLLALIGCLLLVSALALPCFADYVNPSQRPISDPILDVHYMEAAYVTQVDITGYYEIRFNSLGEGGAPGTVLLQSQALLDIIAYHIPTGDATDVKTLYFRGNPSAPFEVVFFTNPDFGGSTTNIFGSASDWVFYVRQYPDFAQNEGTWSLFDYSVYHLVASFEPGKVTSVWTDVMTWVTNAFASIQSVFYLNGSLTFLGTLAVIGVAFAIGWLIVGVVSRFLHLRG